jgi:hypothetical protein
VAFAVDLLLRFFIWHVGTNDLELNMLLYFRLVVDGVRWSPQSSGSLAWHLSHARPLRNQCAYLLYSQPQVVVVEEPASTQV